MAGERGAASEKEAERLREEQEREAEAQRLRLEQEEREREKQEEQEREARPGFLLKVGCLRGAPPLLFIAFLDPKYLFIRGLIWESSSPSRGFFQKAVRFLDGDKFSGCKPLEFGRVS